MERGRGGATLPRALPPRFPTPGVHLLGSHNSYIAHRLYMDWTDGQCCPCLRAYAPTCPRAARAHVPMCPRARHCVNQWSTVPMHPGAGWTQPCNAMRAMGPVNSRVLMIGGSVDRWIVRFLAGGPAGPVHGGLMRLRDRRLMRRKMPRSRETGFLNCIKLA